MTRDDAGAAAAASYLFGNYKILDTVGHGGMGVVYRALDVPLDRVVALKVLRDNLRTRPRLVTRFYREAEAVAKLNHPHIVQIYSVGAVARIPYMAMEYIDAPPLGKIMVEERCIDWRRAFHIAEQVAQALACAHEAQIIHRDIKPGNILVDADERSYVTDFGIAKVLTAEVQLTADGARPGTPQYMSPERCRNEEVTPSSDIYSLGIVLFQMITGRLPFEASTPIGLIRSIISDSPKRVRDFTPDVPEDVDRLVAYMIEKKPGDRPESAQVVAEALARVRDGKALDLTDSSAAKALAAFRDSVATPTPGPRTPTPHSATTTTLDRVGHAGSWLRRRCLRIPAPVRMLISTTGAVLAAVCVGFLAALQADRDFAARAPYGLGQDVALWTQSGVVAQFVDEAPGILIARINLPQFSVSGAGWVSHGPKAVVQLDGLPGTSWERRRAVCLADPVTRLATVCVPPVSAVDGGEGEPSVALVGLGGNARENTPLFGRFFVQVHGRDPETRGSYAEVVAWAGGPGGTRPVRLFRFCNRQDPLTGAVAWAHGVGSLAAKPDGTAVAMAIQVEDDKDAWLLCERSLSQRHADLPYTALSPPGGQISSLQYSRDGSHIVYLRDLGKGRRALWMVRSGGSERDGTCLARGDLNVGPSAFSPDGSLLALTEKRDSVTGELRLIDVTDGRPRVQLGEGFACAWHPSGRFLVAAARDRKGRDQLWAVERRSPHRRRQLTHLGAGAATQCFVSGDGAWALSILPDADQPALIFVDLSRVSFRRQR